MARLVARRFGTVMKMKTTTVLVFLVAAMISAPAYSATVTIIAEGVFSEYNNPDGLLPFAEPAPDTIFTISVTYDDATPTSLLGFSETGIYDDASSDISLIIGSDTFGIGASNSILVINDAVNNTGDYVDTWIASTSTATPTGTPNMIVVEGFSLFLATVSDSVPVLPLSSGELVAPSWPSSWSFGEIRYNISLQSQDGTVPKEELAWAYASITSITVVPIPAAVWLFGSALGLLGWMRRK